MAPLEDELGCFFRNACTLVFFHLFISYSVLFFCPCSGLDAAGKTTFVRRLNGSEVDSVAPTLGFTIYPFSFQGSVGFSCLKSPRPFKVLDLLKS